MSESDLHPEYSSGTSEGEDDFSSDDSFDDEIRSMIFTDEEHTTASDQKSERTRNRRGGGSRTVYVVLLVAAVGFGLATYFLLQSSQDKKFESEFHSFARETADIAENNAENTFGQLKSLATAMTSVAQDSKDRFPNTTVPHFDLRAQEIAELTGAEMILWVPFVDRKDQSGWESYAVENQDWVAQDYEYRGWNASDVQPICENIHNYTIPEGFNDTRRGFVDANNFMEEILSGLGYDSEDFHAPVAQFGPGPINTSLAMMDLFSHPIVKKEIVASLEYDVPVISEIEDLEFLLSHIEDTTPGGRDYTELRSFTLDQVKEDFHNSSRTVGYLVGIVPWRTFFADLLPDSINGIAVKVVSDCGRNFTYVVNGGKDDWAADGDHHDPHYEDMMQQYRFFWKEHPKGTSRHCHFDLYIYPTDEFASIYKSNTPIMYALIVVAVFVFTAVVFFLYDRYIQAHQELLMSSAARAEDIVTSLFPKHVGEQLMQEARNEAADKKAFQSTHSKDSMDDFLGGDNVREGKAKALAELYPNTTVMFADIVGFTAWSSTREPSQVFTLLETIYNSFDQAAKKQRVFKVETVGDCYVAVTGLPRPQENHALIMARFSQSCLNKFHLLVRQMERELGPDTADLGLRVGLHSGQVTAGVLRGERARFQLFGDTVNTAARMESTGRPNRIQVSKETSEFLVDCKKEHWLTPREDKVNAKGKGELDTFWLEVKSNETKSNMSSGRSSNTSLADTNHGVGQSELKAAAQNGGNKHSRLVDWNVDILSSILGDIAQRRVTRSVEPDAPDTLAAAEAEQARISKNQLVLDEVVEIVQLPSYDAKAQSSDKQCEIKLDPEVVSQLHRYVLTISKMYNHNPFHNFEHASHVTMSVRKLLSRIVAPDRKHSGARYLHDNTYGITSDPLTQFAVVLSALLHDVDHLGVPNATLVQESSALAKVYKNKSVAEQNSVDLAWNLLMEDAFEDLRRAIYCTEAEFKRFRQLVVNTILATDIMDKELKNLRNSRWNKAFSSEDEKGRRESKSTAVNRKATIVIEHLIQASDVSHTMQHWHVYRKWNERLFRELYRAFKQGRSETDPSLNWYKGELGFFDFYIIPLAKKLKDCGVFGVSSDEYLNYAEQNRAEWEARGQEVVEEMINKVATENFDKVEVVVEEQEDDASIEVALGRLQQDISERAASMKSVFSA